MFMEGKIKFSYGALTDKHSWQHVKGNETAHTKLKLNAEIWKTTI